MTQRIDLKQRMLVGIAIAKALDRAAGTGSNAKQTEDIFVDGLKNAHVSEERVQRFRDGLAKARQSKEFSYREDVYVMGAIVVYSGILLQVLIGLGVPDLPSRLAWIAFILASMGAVGFLLIHFLRDKQDMQGYGRGVQGILSSFGALGAIAVTACLFFHVWNLIGWLFLCCMFCVITLYVRFRFYAFFHLFLSNFKDILQSLDETARKEAEVEQVMEMRTEK